MEETRHFSDWSFVRDGDLAAISTPIDVLGVNYYSPTKVAAAPDARERIAGTHSNGQRVHRNAEPSPWPGTAG